MLILGNRTEILASLKGEESLLASGRILSPLESQSDAKRGVSLLLPFQGPLTGQDLPHFPDSRGDLRPSDSPEKTFLLLESRDL